MASKKVQQYQLILINSQNLNVEFFAGIMKFDQESKKVTSDKRKGKILCELNDNEEKIIKWIPLDKPSTEPEIEIYVFAGDAKLKKVQKSSGRVYFLSFESYEDKYFFWMQETDESKDQEYCEKVNKFINYDANEMEEEEEEKIHEPLQQQKQQQQQIPGDQSQTDFQKMLSEQFTQAILEIAQQTQKKTKRTSPPLLDVIAPSLDQIIQDQEICQKLITLLPEGQQTKEELINNLKSPQFQQAVDQLEAAILSEENVLAQLGVDISNIKESDDCIFLKYLQQFCQEIDALYKALIAKYQKK